MSKHYCCNKLIKMKSIGYNQFSKKLKLKLHKCYKRG